MELNRMRSAADIRSVVWEEESSSPFLKRAYSLLEIKSVNEEQRIIEGIASTPTTDRMGDIVESKGAEFKLPLPLLWQHNSDQPIGHVIAAKITAAGINIKAQIAKGVLPSIDEAWALIKAGLVRGLSIGFQPLEYSEIKGTGGIRFTRWDWLELSAVTIPANAEASISAIKSVDQTQLRASSGISAARSVVRLAANPPGVSGQPISRNQGHKMKLAERIAAYEAKRAATVARKSEIMDKSGDEGRTLDEAETQEYENLAREVKGIDDYLVKLREEEREAIKGATPIALDTNEQQGSNARGGVVPPILMGKSNLPKGTGFVRMAMCMVAAQGNEQKAAELAKQFKDSTPEVENILRAQACGLQLKTAVAAGNTTDATWAGPLVQYQNLSSEFVELLRPATIVGRIQGIRRVPFNVRIPTQTGGASAKWVGQGLSKPMSALAFSSATFGFSKIAVIVAMTEELVRFSSPSAEAVVRQDMINAIAQYTDQQFIDPSVVAVANVSPASVTNGVTPTQSSGPTIANTVTDIKAAFATFVTNNITLDAGVWIMHPNTALALSMLRTAQDLPAYPDVRINGGTLMGLPIIVSASVPYSTSAGAIIVLMNASDIFLADDGQVTIDLSREASLQFSDSPSTGAQSLVSLWQNNLVGLRAERYINYAVRRTGAVTYIDNVHY